MTKVTQWAARCWRSFNEEGWELSTGASPWIGDRIEIPYYTTNRLVKVLWIVFRVCSSFVLLLLWLVFVAPMLLVIGLLGLLSYPIRWCEQAWKRWRTLKRIKRKAST